MLIIPTERNNRRVFNNHRDLTVKSKFPTSTHNLNNMTEVLKLKKSKFKGLRSGAFSGTSAMFAKCPSIKVFPSKRSGYAT